MGEDLLNVAVRESTLNVWNLLSRGLDLEAYLEGENGASYHLEDPDRRRPWLVRYLRFHPTEGIFGVNQVVRKAQREFAELSREEWASRWSVPLEALP